MVLSNSMMMAGSGTSKRFVSIGFNSSASAMSSDNGSTWVIGTLPAASEWRRVVYGNGVFVAIANNSQHGAYSYDGVNWTQMTLPTMGGSGWYDLAFNGTVFCAILNSTNIAATSTDGINWTQRTLSSSHNWFSIAWNGNVFAVVSADFNTGAGYVTTSPDGITWTDRTGVTNQCYNAGSMMLTAIGSLFVGVGYVDHQSYTSSDNGVTWTAHSMPGATVNRNSVASNGTIAVAVGNDTTSGQPNVCTSTDGVNWTNVGSAGMSAAYDAIWNGSIWCMASGGDAYVSLDGITWNHRSVPGASSATIATS